MAASGGVISATCGALGGAIHGNYLDMIELTHAIHSNSQGDSMCQVSLQSSHNMAAKACTPSHSFAGIGSKAICFLSTKAMCMITLCAAL
eukprot:gnl/MRDRNA2_/MRDRNA2_376454_c0_seq1.p1 gnl/MRDRNA2_/MRDRNA2_376454_c0~~gnl/MRDRNA2_/MRDRNA2_376454_c0_seq1.p1  ORF type:complete len:100 (-),score=15.19 gnl/MRDRNA2_/MRDRNA2_376454_c0_seq1:34-303(-)